MVVSNPLKNISQLGVLFPIYYITTSINMLNILFPKMRKKVASLFRVLMSPTLAGLAVSRCLAQNGALFEVGQDQRPKVV